MSSPDVINLLEKADRSLAAAGHLLMHGFPEFADMLFGQGRK